MKINHIQHILHVNSMPDLKPYIIWRLNQ
jgi:hypothetical protein